MSVVMCDPQTWPCHPLLALRRKSDGASGTLIHTQGQPRHVVHAPCQKVRRLMDNGDDPLTALPGSSEMTCADVSLDWNVDPDQDGCCPE